MISVYCSQCDADVSLCNEKGETALHLAAAGGQVEVVTALLQAGADKDAARADGCLPALAAQRNGHEEVVCVLRLDGNTRELKHSEGLSDFERFQTAGSDVARTSSGESSQKTFEE